MNSPHWPVMWYAPNLKETENILVSFCQTNTLQLPKIVLLELMGVQKSQNASIFVTFFIFLESREKRLERLGYFTITIL